MVLMVNQALTKIIRISRQLPHTLHTSKHRPLRSMLWWEDLNEIRESLVYHRFEIRIFLLTILKI